jgi:hypothetical protein
MFIVQFENITCHWEFSAHHAGLRLVLRLIRNEHFFPNNEVDFVKEEPCKSNSKVSLYLNLSPQLKGKNRQKVLQH